MRTETRTIRGDLKVYGDVCITGTLEIPSGSELTTQASKGRIYISIKTDGSWKKDELIALYLGHFINRNGKRFVMCKKCHNIVNLDKPLFGSFHFCQEN